MSDPESLKKHRERIDELDAKLLELLSKRGKEVQAIGKIKQKAGGSFHVPEREASVMKRLKQLNQGPYEFKAVEGIYREILSASLALEAPLKVAYLGPEATYTHLAAIRKFGAATHFLPQTTLREVFLEVVGERVQYGIVPIENSNEGVVTHTLDLFMEFTLTICGEIQLEINHNLLSKESELKKIKKVYAHPQALGQCRHWLEENLPKAEIAPTDSNAKGAMLAAKEKGAAAIASDYAAELYKLKILRKHIEDYPNNFTRFLVIGKKATHPTGEDKTSIMFSTRDEPGVLFRLLKPLADSGVNLTKIESRPLKKRAWEYVFFIDLDGHVEDPSISKVLKEMERECSFFQVLGSYPREISKTNGRP